VPYRALHTYDWSTSRGERDPTFGGRPIEHACRSVPIRWTGGLVLCTYLRAWLAVPAFLGTMFLLGGLFGDRLQTARGWTFFLGGVRLAEVGLAGWLLLGWLDRRNRAIRRVLGPSEVYGCDPASWTDDRLAEVRKPRKLFGTDTYTEAVDSLLEAGDL